MQQQLLWVEIASKLGPGLALLIMPRLLCRILGLPMSEGHLWPRLVGACLIGLAAASAVEGQYAPGKALGLLGSATINLVIAAVIGGLLILGKGSPLRRGRAALGGSVALLMLVAFIEIVSTR